MIDDLCPTLHWEKNENRNCKFLHCCSKISLMNHKSVQHMRVDVTRNITDSSSKQNHRITDQSMLHLLHIHHLQLVSVHTDWNGIITSLELCHAFKLPSPHSGVLQKQSKSRNPILISMIFLFFSSTWIFWLSKYVLKN